MLFSFFYLKPVLEVKKYINIGWEIRGIYCNKFVNMVYFALKRLRRFENS